MPGVISQTVVVKGYRELLWKLKSLKTQKRKFEAALAQSTNPVQAQGQALARPRPSAALRVFNDNIIVNRCKRYLCEVKEQVKSVKEQVKSAKEQVKEHVKVLATRDSGGSDPAAESNKPRSHVPTVDPTKVNVHASPLELAIRPALLAALGSACHFWMNYLNETTIHNADILEKALFNRPETQGLVTVSNHVASIDDPLILAAALPMRTMVQPDKIRWTMCATDRCFHKELLNGFFRAGKVLPVERGAGVRQWGMVEAERRVSEGDWVHVFPEGTRRTDGTLGPIRRGVGHLVVEAQALAGAAAPAPLVVPFVHAGLEEIMPKGRKWPDTGYRADVVVGEPIDVEDLFVQHRANQLSKEELQTAIVERVGEVLKDMHAEQRARFVQVDKGQPSLAADGAAGSSGAGEAAAAAGPASPAPPRPGLERAGEPPRPRYSAAAQEAPEPSTAPAGGDGLVVQGAGTWLAGRMTGLGSHVVDWSQLVQSKLLSPAEVGKGSGLSDVVASVSLGRQRSMIASGMGGFAALGA